MAKTIEQRRAAARAWKAANKELVKASRAAYFAEHKEKERNNRKGFLTRNPGLKSLYDKRFRAKQKREGKLTWHQKNRKAINDKARERYATDIAYRLQKQIRVLVKQALRLGNARKSSKTIILLGCTIAELKTHLELQFQPGMNWDERSAWHIDHIRPCASFDLTDPEQQRLCFHYTNLQPLWAEVNLAKSSKWEAV